MRKIYIIVLVWEATQSNTISIIKGIQGSVWNEFDLINHIHIDIQIHTLKVNNTVLKITEENIQHNIALLKITMPKLLIDTIKSVKTRLVHNTN